MFSGARSVCFAHAVLTAIIMTYSISFVLERTIWALGMGISNKQMFGRKRQQTFVLRKGSWSQVLLWLYNLVQKKGSGTDACEKLLTAEPVGRTLSKTVISPEIVSGTEGIENCSDVKQRLASSCKCTFGNQNAKLDKQTEGARSSGVFPFLVPV